MKKFVVIRSLCNKARAYAQANYRHFTWFDDPRQAIAALKTIVGKDRPWLVVVDGHGNDLGAASLAMNLGYAVETKATP
jgi:hypothetical protein